MPRKAKEKIDTKDVEIKKKNTTKKASNTSKSESTKKKETIQKSETKKTTTKKVANKKTSTSRDSKSKTNTVKKVAKKPVTTIEYYDLPFRYNETMVKILAQTPTTLFIYWDISDTDKNSYVEKYGKDFFNNSIPVLIVTNITMNYSFEVEINDFANSWYLHVNDANCEYKIELGRKLIENNHEQYIPITISNKMDSPNNHILFDELGNTVFFRNTQTNFIEEKNITSLSYMNNIGKVYKLYQKMYKDNLNNDEIGVKLPSSK